MAEGKQVQDEAGRIVSKGVTPEEFEAGAPELLRHRIGYSVHGLALGSAAYMESVSEKIGGDSE